MPLYRDMPTTTHRPIAPPPGPIPDDVPENIKKACGEEGGSWNNCEVACRTRPHKSCCYDKSKGIHYSSSVTCGAVCPIGDYRQERAGLRGVLSNKECCNLEFVDERDRKNKNINNTIKYNCQEGCRKNTIPHTDFCSGDGNIVDGKGRYSFTDCNNYPPP
jgi:hypothetical protein